MRWLTLPGLVLREEFAVIADLFITGAQEAAAMKIAVVTYGTEGDARPLAALCRALDDAGHGSVLLADASTLGTTQRLGVRSHALTGDIQGTLASVIALGNRPAAAMKALAAIANENATTWLRQTVEAASGCDAIVCSGLA
eukprot:gene53249-72756_t